MTGVSNAAEQALVEGPAGARTEADERPPGRSVARKRTRTPWPYWAPAAVVVVGLLVTAVLALVSNTLYKQDERRLLSLRVKEVAAVLAQAQPGIQIPLASAAALADATGGNVAKFERFVAPYVGSGPGQFVTVSLRRAGAAHPAPITVVGTTPMLAASSPAGQAFLARAARTPKLSVIGLRQPDLIGIGYAFTTPEATSRYIAYGERLLSRNRRSRLDRNSAFSDLDYAVYLGNSERARDLLATSRSHLPVRRQRARMNIRFGDTVLTLVVAPRQSLAGTLPQRLPLIITVVGIILALGAGALTLRLVHRREAAELMTGRIERALDENQRLYGEQRAIAQTLQHALLPDQLPQIRGAVASARFDPGQRGVEIGGDWYDVIPRDERRVLLVVGDVSGRGLRAAATMASLRYAIHAYAAQNDPPATILAKLSRLLNVSSGGQLATVLCVLVDVPAHTVTVASAGHLPPLLVSDGHGEYVEGAIGVPIGVEQDASYTSKTVAAPRAATLLAFTDGLVERRGENLDSGLARLRDAARADRVDLPELLDRLVAELRRTPSDDDTAIVGLRWTD